MPSYTPEAAIRKNARTCVGARSGKNSIVRLPIEVSITTRCFAKSSTVVSTKGSRAGAGLSRMVARVISMRSAGTFSALAATSEIFWATPIPSTTRAKIVYWPSRAA